MIKNIRKLNLIQLTIYFKINNRSWYSSRAVFHVFHVFHVIRAVFHENSKYSPKSF